MSGGIQPRNEVIRERKVGGHWSLLLEGDRKRKERGDVRYSIEKSLRPPASENGVGTVRNSGFFSTGKISRLRLGRSIIKA